MKKSLLAAFITSTLVLTGCGGGGGGSSTAAPSSVPADSNVETPITEEPIVVAPALEGLDLYTDELAASKAATNFTAATDQLLTGAGVTIGIFDTGMLETHDEFETITLGVNSGYYQTKFRAFPDTDLSDPTQFDSLYQSAVNDEGGHGSHVASIIAGKSVGYATGVDLVMIDDSVTESGDIHPWVYQDYLEQLIDDGIRLFNVSQTMCTIRNSIDIAITHYADSLTALDGANGLVVCAGGNESADMTTELVTQTTNKFYHDANDSPWSSDAQIKDNILYVGAVDASGALASFSNFPGADADLQSRWIVALGVGVVGAAIAGDDEYILMDGTSQAAPTVTAAAALMKEKFSSLDLNQIGQALLDTADSTFAGYDVTQHGQGLLDIEAALNIDPSTY